MEKKGNKKATTISICESDHKRLEDYKEYGSEPLWHVIKRILDERSNQVREVTGKR